MRRCRCLRESMVKNIPPAVIVVSGAVAEAPVVTGTAKPRDQVACPLESEPRKDAVTLWGPLPKPGST